MKTKIQMSKPQYIVKPEAGIVVCKIDAESIVDKLFDTFSLYSYSLGKKIKKKFNINSIGHPLTFSAVARLHKGDEWDETLGKRIAESKCKRMIYSFYDRVYTDCIENILHEVAMFNEVNDAVHYAKIREYKHFKELIK